MTFEEYLRSKKIDPNAFKASESVLWESWKTEFDHMHVASFTAQKLYLINPIRRKYHLKTEEKAVPAPVKESVPLILSSTSSETAMVKPPENPEQPKNPSPVKPAVPRPVVRPKPKMN